MKYIQGARTRINEGCTSVEERGAMGEVAEMTTVETDSVARAFIIRKMNAHASKRWRQCQDLRAYSWAMDRPMNEQHRGAGKSTRPVQMTGNRNRRAARSGQERGQIERWGPNRQGIGGTGVQGAGVQEVAAGWGGANEGEQQHGVENVRRPLKGNGADWKEWMTCNDRTWRPESRTQWATI